MPPSSSVVMPLLLAASLCALACASATPDVETPHAGAGSASASTTSATAADALDPITLGGFEFAAYVPPTAPLVIEVASIEALVADIELERFATTYPDVYAHLVGVSTFFFGHDLAGVPQLQALGIDTSGPMGLALLDVGDQQVGVVYARAADAEAVSRAAMEQARLRGGSTQVEPVEASGATILHLRTSSPLVRGWLVHRDGWVMAVLTPAADEVALAHVRSLASVEPRRALATAASFRGAVSKLDAKATQNPGAVRVFYNWGAVALAEAQAIDEELRQSDENDYSVQQLKEARARGDLRSVEYWEQVIRDRAQWAQELRARRVAERRFLSEILAPVSAVALQLETDGTRVAARGFISIPDEQALMARLLVNAPSAPRIAHAVTDAPAMMIHAHTDRATLVELVEALARLESANLPTEARQELSSRFGIDLDKDLLPVLTGELGGRLHFARDAEGRLRLDSASSIEFTVLLGVTSAAEGTALVEKVLGHPLAIAFTRRDGTASRWTVQVPYYRAVEVEVIDTASPALVISTSKSAAQRIAAAATSTIDGAPAGLDALLAQGDTAGLFVQDYTWFMALTSPSPMVSYFGARDAYDPYPGTPASPDTQAKKAELDALLEQQQREIDELEREQNSLTLELLSALGMQAVRLRVEPGGVALDGGFYLGASLADSVGKIGELVGALEASRAAVRKTMEDHWTQRATLDNEYHELRYQDWLNSQATP